MVALNTQGVDKGKKRRKRMTAKEFLFAQNVANGDTDSDAYRKAYKPRADLSDVRVGILAHRVAGRDHVLRQVAALRSKVDRRILVGLNDRLKVLSSIFLDEANSPQERVQAVAVYSRISGDQAPERTETSGPNGGPIPVAAVVVQGPVVAQLPARERLLAMKRAREQRLLGVAPAPAQATEIEANPS